MREQAPDLFEEFNGYPFCCVECAKFPDDADDKLVAEITNAYLTFETSCEESLKKWRKRMRNKEFENEFGEQLAAIRKKAIWPARVIAVVCGLILTLILTTNSLNPINIIEKIKMAKSDDWPLFIVGLLLWLYIAFALKPLFFELLTNQRTRKLWNNFDRS